MNKKIGPQTIIPIVVGAASILVMWLLLQWHGCTDWSVECWKRWDSFHYLTIALDGYTLVPCDEQGGWCGNTGWAPLYPWLIRYIAPLFGHRLQIHALAEYIPFCIFPRLYLFFGHISHILGCFFVFFGIVWLGKIPAMVGWYSSRADGVQLLTGDVYHYSLGCLLCG